MITFQKKPNTLLLLEIFLYSIQLNHLFSDLMNLKITFEISGLR